MPKPLKDGPLRLSSKDPDFAARFDAFVSEERGEEADVAAVVADVIAQIRERRDAALFEFAERFDGLSVSADTIRVPKEEIDAGAAQVDAATLSALNLAADRIEAFHSRQTFPEDRYTDEAGVTLGARYTPMDAVGLYVPGGRAAYPSSLLMNALPAKVAGVPRRTMVTPDKGEGLNPLVLAAAKRAGVTEIYRVGGAQAVAALAFGTESIAPVDKIIGPGNAFVAEAKRRVFGQVGIDMVAGPSEILVVADKHNPPEHIAVDLLSQAEHDPDAQSILITDDAGFADAVVAAVEDWFPHLPLADGCAVPSWRNHGAVILVEDLLREAPPLVNRLAPEHLELAVADPEAYLGPVRHAGSIFLGRMTPEAVGDYVGGTNHVLPTSRRARFSSGLSVSDFMKRTTLLSCSPGGLGAIGGAAVALAQAEGLEAHARSVSVRLAQLNRNG